MFSGPTSNNRAEIEKMVAAAERIQRGLPMAQSIDSYLHTHQEDRVLRRVGMAAIARVILRAERNSYLFGSGMSFYINSSTDQEFPALNNSELQNTWYVPFARQLFSLVPKNEPQRAFENVQFIIFNYDRCLEEFLWLALQAYFDMTGADAAKILSNVEFIHPYGSLGPLPWQESSGRQSIPLGGSKFPKCFQIGESLQTFTESVQSDKGAQVAHAVANAELLILLGFGYLEQNLQLLMPYKLEYGGADLILATAYGIEQPSRKVVSKLIDGLTTKGSEVDSLFVEPGKCCDLFRNYDLLLRF